MGFKKVSSYCLIQFNKWFQVGVEGLQILKPHAQNYNNPAALHVNGIKESAGVNLEVRLVTMDDSVDHEMEWVVENVKFSVEQPVMGFSIYIIVFFSKTLF